MTVEEAKAIVLAKYPLASLIESWDGHLGVGVMVSDWHHQINSRCQAWIQAAERIQREEQP